ncbi:DUF2935 domain-containing protein [Paenibacillus sp. GCM10027627]|uniref:DUF2935 domain-containing protein n=1 Tax=unclassified Paenibacillus TaxID=185978 RepID=UPI0036341AC7
MLDAKEDLTPFQEHSFWLEILEDHAHFMHDFLSPTEEKWVHAAGQYIEAFRGLRNRLSQLNPLLNVQSPEMKEISQAIYPVALGYYRFEGEAQRLRILNEINLNLTPSYLNGTLNENQEYLRLLQYYIHGRQPVPLSLMDLLDLWLEDQLGHAVLLQNVLDPVEIGYSEQADSYAKAFQAHMLKNDAIKGYLRFITPGFAVQMQLARAVSETTAQFYQMVLKIIELFQESSILSRATLRFLEHHLPETCYFIRKLKQFEPSIHKLDNCPLTKPSFPLES